MLKSLLPTLALNLVIILLLFLPAGTFAWPQAWIFLVVFNACSQATGIWLLRTDPELLKARMQSPVGGDQRPRDRAIAVGIFSFFALWLVFMALDAQRFGWSRVPVWGQAIGVLLILVLLLRSLTIFLPALPGLHRIIPRVNLVPYGVAIASAGVITVLLQSGLIGPVLRSGSWGLF